MFGMLDSDIRPFDMVKVVINADAAGCIWPNNAPPGAGQDCWAYVLAVDTHPPRLPAEEAWILSNNDAEEDLNRLTILPVRPLTAVPAELASEPYVVWRTRVFQHAHPPA